MNKLNAFARLCGQVLLLCFVTACAETAKTPPSQPVAEQTHSADSTPSQSDKPEVADKKTDQQRPQPNKEFLLSKQNQGKGKPNKPRPGGVIPGTGRCGLMSQGQCLASQRCVLDQNDNKGYFCREAKGDCEIGFIQAGEGDPKASCNRTKGCQYVGASCFCPQGVQCICGGGKPSSCRSRASASDLRDF